MSEDTTAAMGAAGQAGGLPDGPAPEAHRAATVRAVDFRRPRQFSGEVQRRLRRSLDTFCRTASSRLSAELRTAVDLEVIAVDQLTWSDAHAQLPATSVTAVLGVEPHATRLLLAAELELLLASIDRMLGGLGEAPPPTRRLTDIDMMLATGLFEMMIDQLSIIWSEQIETELSVGAVVAQPQTAQLAPMSEPTLAFTLEVGFLGRPSTLTLLVPYHSIVPLLDRLTAVDGADGDGHALAAEAMRHEIGSVEMEVRAEVGAVELPVGQVLEMRTGDVVRLGASVVDGVALWVGETAVSVGQPGRSGAHRAVQTSAVAREAA